jgi:hypothetical protein
MASHLCPRGIARTEWSKVPVKTVAKQLLQQSLPIDGHIRARPLVSNRHASVWSIEQTHRVTRPSEKAAAPPSHALIK